MASPERHHSPRRRALAGAIEAALQARGVPELISAASRPPLPAPPGAAPRNMAPQIAQSPVRTNPPRAAQPLKPKQYTAARLLLAGQSITEVAARLGIHRYTVTRWQSDPRFVAELRRQTAAAAARAEAGAGAAPRNNAPRRRTFSEVMGMNEPTAEASYSAPPSRAILGGPPRPVQRADP